MIRPKITEHTDNSIFYQIIGILSQLIDPDHPLINLITKLDLYPFKILFVREVREVSDEQSDPIDLSGEEFLKDYPRQTYGIFHADPNWRDIALDDQQILDSFSDKGSQRTTSFPNLGWYYGALTFISREVLLFFKPDSTGNWTNYVNQTLIPVSLSSLIRETVFILFEEKIKPTIRERLGWFERNIPYLIYKRLRKLQEELLSYTQEIDDELAVDRNFRWFTEVDIFQEIENIRYVNEREKNLVRLQTIMTDFIANEANFLSGVWLFVFTLLIGAITVFPFIIDAIIGLISFIWWVLQNFFPA